MFFWHLRVSNSERQRAISGWKQNRMELQKASSEEIISSNSNELQHIQQRSRRFFFETVRHALRAAAKSTSE
jgi:hypothetical protein